MKHDYKAVRPCVSGLQFVITQAAPTLSKSLSSTYIGGAGRKTGYGDKRLSE